MRNDISLDISLISEEPAPVDLGTAVDGDWVVNDLDVGLSSEFNWSRESKRWGGVVEAIDVHGAGKSVEDLVVHIDKHISGSRGVHETNAGEIAIDVSSRGLEQGPIKGEIEVISIDCWFSDDGSGEGKSASCIDRGGISRFDDGVDDSELVLDERVEVVHNEVHSSRVQVVSNELLDRLGAGQRGYDRFWELEGHDRSAAERDGRYEESAVRLSSKSDSYINLRNCESCFNFSSSRGAAVGQGIEAIEINVRIDQGDLDWVGALEEGKIHVLLVIIHNAHWDVGQLIAGTWLGAWLVWKRQIMGKLK